MSAIFSTIIGITIFAILGIERLISKNENKIIKDDNFEVINLNG